MPEAHRHLLEKPWGQEGSLRWRSTMAARCGCSLRWERAPAIRRPSARPEARSSAARHRAIEADPFVRERWRISAPASRAVDQAGQIAPTFRLEDRGADAMMKGQIAGLMKQAQQMQENMKRLQMSWRPWRSRASRRGPGEGDHDLPARCEARHHRSEPLSDDKDMLEDRWRRRSATRSARRQPGADMTTRRRRRG